MEISKKLKKRKKSKHKKNDIVINTIKRQFFYKRNKKDLFELN